MMDHHLVQVHALFSNIRLLVVPPSSSSPVPSSTLSTSSSEIEKCSLLPLGPKPVSGPCWSRGAQTSIPTIILMPFPNYVTFIELLFKVGPVNLYSIFNILNLRSSSIRLKYIIYKI